MIEPLGVKLASEDISWVGRKVAAGVWLYWSSQRPHYALLAAYGKTAELGWNKDSYTITLHQEGRATIETTTYPTRETLASAIKAKFPLDFVGDSIEFLMGRITMAREVTIKVLLDYEDSAEAAEEAKRAFSSRIHVLGVNVLEVRGRITSLSPAGGRPPEYS